MGKFRSKQRQLVTAVSRYCRDFDAVCSCYTTKYYLGNDNLASLDRQHY